jgi:hypothetical protein
MHSENYTGLSIPTTYNIRLIDEYTILMVCLHDLVPLQWYAYPINMV